MTLMTNLERTRLCINFYLLDQWLISSMVQLIVQKKKKMLLECSSSGSASPRSFLSPLGLDMVQQFSTPTTEKKRNPAASILNIHTATVKVCGTLLKVEFNDRTVQVCFVGKVVYIANTVKSPPTNNETKIPLFTLGFVHFFINNQKLSLFFFCLVHPWGKKEDFFFKRERTSAW